LIKIDQLIKQLDLNARKANFGWTGDLDEDGEY
jgi:hypothetical protein